MSDDKIVKDTARDPEREALGPTRGGIRAAAKRAAGKVVKKAVRKKTTKTATKTTTKKAAATTGKTTKKKVARAAAKTDKPAAAKVSASAPKAPPASRTPPAPGTAPARSSAARGGTGSARTGPAAAASGPPAAPGAAVAGSGAASEGVASTPSGPAARPPEPGSSFETPRPPGPMHPGAAMDSMHEHAGGFGSLMALWGPLIIVGFLVLVFRGGEEREATVAAGPDASGGAASVASAEEAMSEPRVATPGSSASAALPPARAPEPTITAHRDAGVFDRGFAMPAAMAGPPVYPGRGPGAGMPAVAPGRLYPPPPGPYRDPRYRSLPTGESWSADGAGEWSWPAPGRAASEQEDAGEASVQWVQCAPPYYWCPAPGTPTW